MNNLIKHITIIPLSIIFVTKFKYFIFTGVFNNSVDILILSFVIVLITIALILFHIKRNRSQKIAINKYEKQIKQSKSEISNFYNYFSDIIIQTNKIGVIEKVSPTVIKITGFNQSYYTKKHISKVFQKIEEWNEFSEKISKNEKIVDQIYTIKTKFEKKVLCSVTIHPIQNKKGEISGYEGVIKDFSQRIYTQQKIEQLETLLDESLYFSNSGRSNYLKNKQTFTLDEPFSKILKISQSDKILKADYFWNLFHPEDRKKTKEAFNLLINESLPNVVIESRIKSDNEQYQWFSNKFFIQKNKKGKNIDEVIGIHTRIDSSKKLENENQIKTRKLNALFKAIDSMILIIDKEFFVHEANESFIDFVKMDKISILGQKIEDIFINRSLNHFSKFLVENIKYSFDNKKNINKKELICHNNSNRSYYIINTNIFLDDNELKCLVNIIDNTNAKTKEEKVQEKVSILEKKEKESAYLINRIAEEISKPINQIILHSDSIKSETDIQKLNASRLKIKEEAQSILDFIDEIKDLYEIKSKNIYLNLETFKIHSFIQHIINSLEKHKPNQNIKVLSQINLPEQKNTIKTDSTKLKNLIINLIRYIWKLSEDSKIIIKLKYENNSFVFIIETNNFTDKLTKNDLPFKLVRELAIAIQSEFSINETNSKCYFTIVIPDTNIDKESIKPESKTIKNAKILIVEDEDYNIYYLQQILNMEGYQNVVAEDGQKAIDIVKKDDNIDLILMDIRLPGIDGLETSKRIKAFKPDIPIIAQTAFSLNSEEDFMMEKYCDDYIQKPIVSKVLFTKINNNLKSIDNES